MIIEDTFKQIVHVATNYFEFIIEELLLYKLKKFDFNRTCR